jgi:SAGA-associated factor 29
VLGQVISYRSELNVYEILDIDDHQRYMLPESQVLALGQADTQKKLSKGETVFALYPDTTIFYPATIIQVPKRSAKKSEAIVTVQIIGDEDADGIAPLLSIPLKYVVRTN